ncbi:unnamed protein product [Arabidopsis thaliana]|uniref:Transmembrane protein n=1 Tax=Arabidopsis thaliana TaxID=3702 RepID=A0A654ELF0_ARATH|nr:unnamed protein product [Arabidopsis thaliana]
MLLFCVATVVFDKLRFQLSVVAISPLLLRTLQIALLCVLASFLRLDCALEDYSWTETKNRSHMTQGEYMVDDLEFHVDGLVSGLMRKVSKAKCMSYQGVLLSAMALLLS